MKTLVYLATAAAMLVRLRAFSNTANQLQVDRAAGVIRNASVMKAGPALGHGFVIDGTMLRQVADQINARGGVPVRYTHPQRELPDGTMEETDSLGTHVGTLRNARIDGDAVRGDLYFGPYADKLPVLGNVRDYLMDLAASDPESFGLSAAFVPGNYDKDIVSGAVLGRSKDVAACDLTGSPAANPNGLLAAARTTSGADAPDRTAINKLAMDLLCYGTGCNREALETVIAAMTCEDDEESMTIEGEDERGEEELEQELEELVQELEELDPEEQALSAKHLSYKRNAAGVVSLAYQVAGMAAVASALGYKVTDFSVMRPGDCLSLCAFDFPKGAAVDDLFAIAAGGVMAAAHLTSAKPAQRLALMAPAGSAPARPLDLLSELSRLQATPFASRWKAAMGRVHPIIQRGAAGIHEVARSALAP